MANEPQTFAAMVVRRESNGSYSRAIEERRLAELPAGDVLIAVQYSSLNYKDGLSATGAPGVTRHYPHTPGIDAAGFVVESRSDLFAAGDEVVVTGNDLGAGTDGGFGQFIRVPAPWVVRLPVGLSPRQSMIYGTAGFTAAMCLERLENHPAKPSDGQVLVTGATGGLGSITVALLAARGYEVVAVTGKKHQEGFLRRLGAVEIISREAAIDDSGRALLRGRWAAAIDAVGGEMLATAIKATKPGGAIMACGNVLSPTLHTTVFPFILRGVTLYGIESARCSQAFRSDLWRKLANEWRVPALESLARECSLTALEPEIDRILNGEQTGRVVVRL